AAAKAFAPKHGRDPGHQSNGDAPGGTDPVIVESEFQEVGDPDQQRGDADAVQPVRADARLEVRVRLSRVSYGWLRNDWIRRCWRQGMIGGCDWWRGLSRRGRRWRRLRRNRC